MPELLEVLKYPDPILRRGGKDITEFDDALRDTAKSMFHTMYNYRGVGLAAPQVGLDLNLLVLNPVGDEASACHRVFGLHVLRTIDLADEIDIVGAE